MFSHKYQLFLLVLGFLFHVEQSIAVVSVFTIIRIKKWLMILLFQEKNVLNLGDGKKCFT
jgi:hypothetical protein